MFKWLRNLLGGGKVEESRTVVEESQVEVERLRVKLVIFRDKGKRWRWRLRAMNNKIVATSHDAYKNKGDCVEMAEFIVGSLEVVEREIQGE